MKKLLCTILALVMAMSIAGCGETPSTQPDASATKETNNEFDGKWDTKAITITTGPSGGTHEIVGAAAAEIWKTCIPGVNFSAVPSSGTTANLPLMEAGEADLGTCTGDSAASALKGAAPYDKVYSNASAIFSLYPNTLQIWVQEDSDIQDFGDLIDKKFTFAAPGSGPFQPTLNMMELFGFTEDDVAKAGGTIEYLDWSTATSKLQDGILDAVIWTTSYPAAKIVEVETTRSLRLLQVDPAMLEKFCETYGGWISITIPAGTYKNQDKDVTTIGTPNFIAVNNDVDNDLVYEMTKALWENRDTLGNTYALLKDISLENVATGMGFDLHPGALKFFQEIGAVID